MGRDIEVTFVLEQPDSEEIRQEIEEKYSQIAKDWELNPMVFYNPSPTETEFVLAGRGVEFEDVEDTWVPMFTSISPEISVYIQYNEAYEDSITAWYGAGAVSNQLAAKLEILREISVEIPSLLEKAKAELPQHFLEAYAQQLVLIPLWLKTSTDTVAAVITHLNKKEEGKKNV